VLRAHGWDPLRVTGYDVERDPDGVISEVRALLERATSRAMAG
jgi:very-short-patch-repair endonuclease